MLAIISVLSLGMTEKLSMLFLIKNKHTQELKIMLNYLLISVIFLGISLIKYESFDFSFFYDITFFVTLFLENFVFYFAIKNYNKQKSFSQIAFATFSSLYLIILIGYFYHEVIGLNMVLSSPYNNIYEVIGFSFLFFILTILFFYEKLKNNHINHPLDLLFYAVLLVNVLYFSILTIQNYQSFLVYIFVFLSLSFQQFIWSVRKFGLPSIKKELLLTGLNKSEKIIEIKNTLIYFILYLVTFLLSVTSANLMPVEFFAIFKRTGSIISSYIIDGFILNKDTKIPAKDILILMIIIITVLYLYFR